MSYKITFVPYEKNSRQKTNIGRYSQLSFEDTIKICEFPRWMSLCS